MLFFISFEKTQLFYGLSGDLLLSLLAITTRLCLCHLTYFTQQNETIAAVVFCLFNGLSSAVTLSTEVVKCYSKNC